MFGLGLGTMFMVTHLHGLGFAIKVRAAIIAAFIGIQARSREPSAREESASRMACGVVWFSSLPIDCAVRICFALGSYRPLESGSRCAWSGNYLLKVFVSRLW